MPKYYPKKSVPGGSAPLTEYTVPCAQKSVSPQPNGSSAAFCRAHSRDQQTHGQTDYVTTVTIVVVLAKVT